MHYRNDARNRRVITAFFWTSIHRIRLVLSVGIGTLIALNSGMNSMNLSMLLSALWTMAEDQLSMHESVDAMHAPLECHSLVARGFGRKVHELITNCGYVDSDHLTRAVDSLGAGKWLHFSHIGYALSAASEYEYTSRY